MVSSPDSFRRTYPATRESLPIVRGEVAEYAARIAGFEGQRLDAIRLAVSEAVTNAIVHGYPSQADAEVRVTAAVVEGTLVVLVVDDGCGYRTPARTPGLGYGLPLMSESADELVLHERAEGGTEARMSFRLPGLVAGAA